MDEEIAFDAHRFVKHLTQEGFALGQVEVLVEEQVNLINSNLATKADIAAVKADIATVKANIAAVEVTLKADMAALKVDLLKWMFGALIAQGGLIVAFVKLP